MTDTFEPGRNEPGKTRRAGFVVRRRPDDPDDLRRVRPRRSRELAPPAVVAVLRVTVVVGLAVLLFLLVR